jgi:hypothetical protein
MTWNRWQPSHVIMMRGLVRGGDVFVKDGHLECHSPCVKLQQGAAKGSCRAIGRRMRSASAIRLLSAHGRGAGSNAGDLVDRRSVGRNSAAEAEAVFTVGSGRVRLVSLA